MIGFIIAGGQSCRMNTARKCLCDLDGKSILERIISRTKDQVDELVLNANDPEPELAAFDLSIIRDELSGSLGPLAGLHACLKYAAKKSPPETWIATFASDTPFIPTDMVAKLLAAATEKTEAVIATSAGRPHPLSAIWRAGLLPRLERAILDENLRAVRHWLAQLKVEEVEFEASLYDSFFNINDRDDLAAGERLARKYNL